MICMEMRARGGVGDHEDAEAEGEGELGGEEPAEFVVPAFPFPGAEEAGETGETPDGGDHAGRRGDVFVTGDEGEFGEDGDEDEDGDVGKGVADPCELEEELGFAAGGGVVEFVGGVGGVFGVFFAELIIFNGEEEEDEEAEGAGGGGDPEDAAPRPAFEGAAGEEGDEVGEAPGEVVAGHACAEGHAAGAAGDGGFHGGPDGGAGEVVAEHDGGDDPDGGELDCEEGPQEGGEDAGGGGEVEGVARAPAFAEFSGEEGDEDVSEAPEGAHPEAGAGAGADVVGGGVVVAADGEEGGGVGGEEFGGEPGADELEIGFEFDGGRLRRK